MVKFSMNIGASFVVDTGATGASQSAANAVGRRTAHRTTGTTGIVVVNFNSHLLLGANLPAADELGPDFQVVVVDNYSTEAERASLLSLGKTSGWDVVALAGNDGFGAAVNVGVVRARELGSSTFLVLNPDAVLTVEVAGKLRQHVRAHPADLVAPLIRDPSGQIVFQGSLVSLRTGRMSRDRSTIDDPPRPPQLSGTAVEPASVRRWITGACFAIHHDLWTKIGGFDPAFFLYWEDVDLSLRAEDAGGRLVIRRDLSVVHDEGGTQGERRGRAKSNTYYYFNARNRMMFAARHLNRRGVVRWLLSTPVETWRILMRGGRRQLWEAPSALFAAGRGGLAAISIGVNAALTFQRVEFPSPPAEPRRRLLVAHPSADFCTSGRSLLELVDAFLRDGFDVTVTVPRTGALVPQLRQHGATVVLCRTPVLHERDFGLIGSLRLTTDFVRGAAPAIHLVRRAAAHGVFVNTDTIPLWLFLGRVFGRQVTCHVHDAKPAAPTWIRRLRAAPLVCAQVVVLDSPVSLGVLIDAVPRLAARSHVVCTEVAGPPVVQPARQELNEPVRLLFIGRFSPQGGAQVAIEVCRLLVQDGIDVRLELLGSVQPAYGWFERNLRMTVTAGVIEQRITFRRFTSDIWPSLADSDVVLIPSAFDEPFRTVALEAVLGARPLVVSATSGLREAATGYRSAQAVDPARPDLWAAAVRSVIGAWPEFCAAAMDDAHKAAEHHSARRCGEQIVHLVKTGNRVSVR